jgi:hypothetical protein
MKTKILYGVFFGLVLLITTSCASLESARHEYIMRGQILESADDGVYLCIGSADGAKVGQEYAVYKFVRNTTTLKARPTFAKEDTGTVKITEITDEHYAKAKVIAGEAKVNSVVELKE